MPRISNRIIIQAYQHSPFLPFLLRECRSLESAKNELRWLRERARLITTQMLLGGSGPGHYPTPVWRGLLRSMCLSRSRGMPLQYILGDQPFGDLDIKCTKGVLIPRHETEAITFRAAKLILDMLMNSRVAINESTPLRVLDLCTGTGCIPLLLHALLSSHYPQLSIIGIDISAAAIRLARENTKRNVHLKTLSKRALTEVSFRRGNVLGSGHDDSIISGKAFPGFPVVTGDPGLRCDVLISNPPYVSPKEYLDGTTSRSVRKFEPELALVPPDSALLSVAGDKTLRREDIFYHRIAALIPRLRVKLSVLECGSHSQAVRVAALYKDVLHKTESDEYVVDIWSVTGHNSGPCAVTVYPISSNSRG
ncbi:S-adenosyl-L-methionine-dependent methyltransferase [Aspergillus californicus]